MGSCRVTSVGARNVSVPRGGDIFPWWGYTSVHKVARALYLNVSIQKLLSAFFHVSLIAGYEWHDLI